MAICIDGIGRLVQDARLQRGLTIEQFAVFACCRPEDLRALEEGRMQAGMSIGAQLGASDDAFNVTISLASEEPAETTLFNYELREAQKKAYGIIYDQRLTNSYDVVREVMRSLDREHELAAIESRSDARAFRQRRGWLKIDEERVRDLVRQASRRLGR